ARWGGRGPVCRRSRRPAGYGDHGGGRRGARRARGLRRRRAGCAGIELLPWAGAVDALADAGVGRLRRRRCACRAADPPPRAFRAALLRPWVRFQWADGRVGVVQLLPPHLGFPHPPPPPPPLVRFPPRNPKPPPPA